MCQSRALTFMALISRACARGAPINRSQRDHPKTERARFRLGANDGARAFAANATDDDDVAAAAAGRAARFSYGVIENRRH